MAPLKPVKKGDSDKRVLAVLEAAKRISGLLQSRSTLPSNLEGELEGIVKRTFPIPSTSTLAGSLSTLDSLGCELWNGATNILRTEETPKDLRLRQNDNTRIVVLLRVFAFLLLDTAQQASAKRAKDQEQLIRNFRIGIKAGRFCLDKGDTECASQVLERCAEHVRVAEEGSPLVSLTERDGDSGNRTALKSLISEFYLLRVTHAWKSERSDLADHFFKMISISQLADSGNLSEKAASLFCEIGKSLSKKKDVECALLWLERGYSVLNACDLEHLSHDAGELRLAISAAFVETLLLIRSEESLKQAETIVEQLRVAYGLGNRLTVHLMELKIILANGTPNEKRLKHAISALLWSAVLTEQTFRIIMQCVHRVRKAKPEIACHAIEELITGRLLPDLSAVQGSDTTIQTWIEKTCVTYTLFATSNLETARTFAAEALQRILDNVAQNSSDLFSAKATHAMQTLIWKAAGDTNSNIAEKWCELLRHPLFEGAGQTNKARIGRKAISMAMARNDITAARAAFFQMPSSAQNENISRYIAFKLALLSNDYEFANESLAVVMKHADRDPTFLYACVLEAQQSQMRHIAVAALQGILDKLPPGVHLPSLLRCTVRLLIGELEAQSQEQDELMEEILRVFENAATNRQTLQKDSGQQWRAEIQWWAKNAYNLALKLCGQIHPEHLVRLLSVCIQFIDCFPEDDGPMHQHDLKNRQILCHFLSASALVVLGRSNIEGSEESLQCYLQARQEIEAFKSLQQKVDERDSDKENKHRLFEVLKFDLECILNLQQWDQLDAALQACLDLGHIDRWDSLADIVLIIHRQSGSIGLNTPGNTRMTELLQRIINDTWQRDKNLVKASRWLRLSFSMDLSEGNGEFALKLATQAASMAKKGYDGRNGHFPETELQWLATTSFNKAVDLLSLGEREACTVWIDGALELARYAADNGALHANFTYKKEQAMERVKAAAV